MDVIFFLNSVLLGVGLAMDAFSVSIVNAITEPSMTWRRQCAIAGVYAFFQFAMPMAGWLCVRTVATIFTAFQQFIPWIALLLLLYIGGKMVWEAARSGRRGRAGGPSCGEGGARGAGGPSVGTGRSDGEKDGGQAGGSAHAPFDAAPAPSEAIGRRLSFPVLLMQGVATSIDALSVGFTVADYGALMAVASSAIIAAVTFAVCMGGLLIGRAAGKRLPAHAQLFGGAILIAIGIEIFVKGVLR